MMSTATPELARPKKMGLQRVLHHSDDTNQGTPAPGAGYALTIAHREIEKLTFAHAHDRRDVELGIALIAAKRASLVGRGPILSDVHVALNLFGLRSTGVIDHHLSAPFAGLSHSYEVQRRLVDSVANQRLVPGDVGVWTSH